MAISERELLSRFEGVKSRGQNKWQAKCPCHGDNVASLSIEFLNGTWLLCCHAGCDTGNIIEEKGLTWGDLGTEKAPETWKDKAKEYYAKQLGWPILSVIEYRYIDENNVYQYSRIRLQGKKNKALRYATIIFDKIIFSKNDKPPILYNIHKLVKYNSNPKKPIYIVEGEKDADRLNREGMFAITAGSATGWKSEFNNYLIGHYVCILPDNDNAGGLMEKQVLKELHGYAYAVKSIIISSEEHGDVSNFLEEGNTKDDLLNIIEPTEYKYAPWVSISGSEGKQKQSLNPDILANTIIKHNTFLLTQDEATEKPLVYLYESGVYRRYSQNDMGHVVRRYIPVGKAKDHQIRETVSLIIKSVNNRCDYNNLDSDENIINVKNGLYDKSTKRLKPFDKKILSTIQLNCNLDLNSKNPNNFIKYIHEFCSDSNGNIDQLQVQMAQEWMGLILSNIKGHRVKAALFLYSLEGNTGKSVFLDIICSLLGYKNVINIPLQKLSDRFSLGDVYGKRVISSGDNESSELSDTSIFKQLTGGDPLRAEMKGMQSFSFTFNGLLQIACNNLPYISDDKGNHLFERMLIMHCRNVIPPERRDPYLRDKLLKEADGIFQWALEGLHRLEANNFKFTIPQSSIDIKNEYRDLSDSIHCFITEKCIVTHDKSDRIKKTIFEEDYKNWLSEEEKLGIKKGKIKGRMEKNGFKLAKISDYYYVGLRWKDKLPY